MTSQHGMHTNRSKYHMHPQTVASKLIGQLADGPKTASELPGSLHHDTLAAEYVDKLSFGGGDGDYNCSTTDSPRGGAAGGPVPNTLYYLYGDDRQVARELVRRHPQFVAECVEAGGRKLRARISDPMYRLIVEEQQIAARNED